MTRAPEVKMLLVTPLIMAVVFGAMILPRQSARPPDPAAQGASPQGAQRWGGTGPLPELARPFTATGAMAFTVFVLLQLLCNQFGFDRDGFRALVLLPTPRRYILMAKNLAIAPFALGIGVIVLVVVKFVVRSSWVVVAAAALQLLAMYLLASIAGNLASIIAPYRISPGSLKPTKTTTRTTLLILAFHLTFPVVLAPAFVPPIVELMARSFGKFATVPINLLLSVPLLAFVAGLYWIALAGTATLLEHREKEILQAVTQEVE
jgi:hypothetical protein